MDVRSEGGTEGRVIVFTGPGKGKTSAALGAAVRAIAHGGRVIFVHFTGPRYPVLGEVKTAAAIGRNWKMVGIRSEAKDIAYLNDFSESVDTVREAMAMAYDLWLHKCDLLVLDDIGFHLDRGSIDIAQVLSLIDNRPPNTSIILTGQTVPKSILQRADLVTEFLKIKQPLNVGMRPREGIDF